MTTLSLPDPPTQATDAPGASISYGPRTSILPARETLIVLAVITLVGAGLRFTLLDKVPFWLDEAATYSFARWPVGELWSEALRREPNPPLYYTLHHYWLNIGHSERSVRALPALIGTLTIPLMYLLGAAFGGRRIGLLAAALLAASPIHVQYSQEARAYALLIAAATLALAGWVELLKRPEAARRPDRLAAGAWLAYVVGNVLALYTHNLGVLLPAITGGFALAWWLLRHYGDWRLFAVWAAAGGAIILAWAWWVPVLAQQTGVVAKNWHMPEPTLRLAVTELERVYGHAHAWMLRPLADAAVLVLAAMGVWRWRRQPERLWPVVVVVVAAPLLTLAISFYQPIYLTRTLLWPMPAMLALVAAGLWSIGPARLRWLVVGAFIGMQAWGLGRYYAVFDKDEPWDRLVRAIEAQHEPGDVVVSESGPSLWPLDYYLDDIDNPPPRYAAVTALPEEGSDTGLMLQTTPLRRDANPGHRLPLCPTLLEAKRVWLVIRGQDRDGRVGRGLTLLGLRPTRNEQFDKLALRLMERVAPPVEE